MTHSEFNEFLKALPSLSPDELQQLRQALNEVAPISLENETPEEEDQRVQRELHARGLLKEIKPSHIDATPYMNRKPIPILHGKPLSETIIEERR